MLLLFWNGRPTQGSLGPGGGEYFQVETPLSPPPTSKKPEKIELRHKKPKLPKQRKIPRRELKTTEKVVPIQLPPYTGSVAKPVLLPGMGKIYGSIEELQKTPVTPQDDDDILLLLLYLD